MPYSLRMAIEGASVSRGHRPAWLERASDVRFVGYSHEGDQTLLCLSAPSLGEAAEELYKQHKFWETCPAPDQTAVDVLANVVREVGSGNAESDWFDQSLLDRFAKLDGLFSSRLRAVHLPAVKVGRKKGFDASVDDSIVKAACNLSNRTPPSRQVRVTGTLDMIRHSTRSFGLQLDDGTEIRGVAENYELMDSLKEHFSKKVLVLGKAVYRPSGRLLRVDTHAVESGENQPSVFAKVPQPRSRQPQPVRENPAARGKQGVAAFFGTWPGDETDAELEAMLREVRG